MPNLSTPEPFMFQPCACEECLEKAPFFVVPDPKMTLNSAGRPRFVRVDLQCPSCLLDRATRDRRESYEAIILYGWEAYLRASLSADLSGNLSAVYLWHFMGIDEFHLSGLFIPMVGRPEVRVPWSIGSVNGRLIAASMQAMRTNIPMIIEANYLRGDRWPEVRFIGGSDKLGDYEELVKGVGTLQTFARANSGRQRRVSREQFAAEVPGVYHKLAADYDSVTLEQLGEKFKGVSGRTISSYIKEYRRDGHDWPPPYPED